MRFLFFLVLLLIFTACTGSNVDNTPAVSENISMSFDINANIEEKEYKTYFSFDEFRSSYYLDDWTLHELAPYHSFQEMTEDNMSVNLRGEVVVAGDFYFDEYERVCFDFGEQSKKKMPRLVNDESEIHYCLNRFDSDIVEKEFDPALPTGHKTILIDQYEYKYGYDDNGEFPEFDTQTVWLKEVLEP